jgi:hypothetical protein
MVDLGRYGLANPSTSCHVACIAISQDLALYQHEWSFCHV